MKLNELKPKDGAVTKKFIKGRGIGSGKGKTAGKGHKGQKARTGVALKGFEGGQMPLDRRLPKFGFANIFRKEYAELTLGRLQAGIDAKKIDAKKPLDEDALVKSGIVRRKKDGIKLLASGELKTKVELKIVAATKAAIEAVEKAGGSVEITYKETPPLEKGKKKPKAEGKEPKKAAKKPAKKAK